MHLDYPHFGGLHHRYERIAALEDSLAPKLGSRYPVAPLVCTNGEVHTESQFIFDAQRSCDIMKLQEPSFQAGMLLGKVKRDSRPVETAVRQGMIHLKRFAVSAGR